MKIAILGYGVVGSGAYEILTKSGFDVARVLDLRAHDELGDILTNDYDVILNDKEIGVVVEAIGGLEPAHTFLVKAIKAGKHVVSSNKHVVCTFFNELHTLAYEYGVTLRYTASVGGGIPWLHNLSRFIRCDNVTKICGIMNGTTNFMLDAMITDSRDFDDVLREAQALGYAEADPSADIDGFDTARKTAISASIAFSTEVSESSVDIFSMRNIKKCDIEYIKGELGMIVRYLGMAVKCGNKISAYVEPTLVPTTSMLAGVRKNNNMISLVGDNIGELSFVGQGAGKYPTGLAVANDVVDIIQRSEKKKYAPNECEVDNATQIKKYYVRTKADINADVIESCKVDGQYKYIITKPISVSEIHKISDEISDKDGEIFCAGIQC